MNSSLKLDFYRFIILLEATVSQEVFPATSV